MNKTLLFLIPCVILTACISEEERRESYYRYEQTMLNQCGSMGFRTGTQDYMNCRMFYDEYFKEKGYSTDYLSYYEVGNIQNAVNSLNSRCYYYWGQGRISGASLWNCVQQLGEKEIAEIKHQKALREQEQILIDSITAGQKAAYDDARLQSRIDAERERVARETGKKPSKVKCKTYYKSNDYIQVKCK